MQLKIDRQSLDSSTRDRELVELILAENQETSSSGYRNRKLDNQPLLWRKIRPDWSVMAADISQDTLDLSLERYLRSKSQSLFYQNGSCFSRNFFKI